MRLTADYDMKRGSRPMFLLSTALNITKGIFLTRKFPNEIRRSPSGKGFHAIWKGLDIDERTMLKYRFIIGDDRKRIRFDMRYGDKRMQKQILFTKKKFRIKINGKTYEFDQFHKEDVIRLLNEERELQISS